MSIDPSKSYFATIKTEKGDIRVQLHADKAPNTVNSFVFLARQGFYDNTTFHRVISGFMAQGGDPTGTGSGGPGYRFADEIVADLKFDAEGVVAMANAGANTNGSQFFITYAAQPHLNGGYSIFGKVVSGMDVAKAIDLRDPATAAKPGTKILTIAIEEK
jgi:peptidyl-prolyl cis-trans isomerase B (cyclophilin B)